MDLAGTALVVFMAVGAEVYSRGVEVSTMMTLQQVEVWG